MYGILNNDARQDEEKDLVDTQEHEASEKEIELRIKEEELTKRKQALANK